MKDFIKKNHFIVVAIITYLALFVFGLTFEYIEGDESASILFHLLGRDPNVQPRYASYQYFFDHILSIIPAQETTLIYFSYILTFFSGFAVTVLGSRLVATILDSDRKNFIGYMLLFGLPEILFQSLIFNPSLVAIAILISMYYYVRRRIVGIAKFPIMPLVVLAVCSAIAISIRLDTIYFVFILLLDLLVAHIRQYKLKGAVMKAVQISLTGISVLVLYYLMFSLSTEFDYTELQSRVNEQAAHSKVVISKNTMILTVLTLQSFFHPLGILALLLGVVVIARGNNKFLLIVIAASFLLIPPDALTVNPAPKMFISSWVFIFLTMASGYLLIAKYKIGRIAIVVGIAAIWFGAILGEGNSRYGPNFKLNRSFSQSKEKAELSPKPTVMNSGFIVPTQEGPRSIYGYFFTLFRDWRKVHTGQESEYNKFCVEELSSKNIVIQGLNGSSYPDLMLLRNGYARVIDTTLDIQKLRKYQKESTGEIAIVVRTENSDYLETTSASEYAKKVEAIFNGKLTYYYFLNTSSALDKLKKTRQVETTGHPFFYKEQVPINSTTAPI